MMEEEMEEEVDEEMDVQCTSVNDGQRLESMALSSVAPPPITSMELPFLPFAPTAVYCVRAI